METEIRSASAQLAAMCLNILHGPILYPEEMTPYIQLSFPSYLSCPLFRANSKVSIVNMLDFVGIA